MVRSMAHFKLGNLDAAHTDQDAAIRLSDKDALTVSPINLTLYEGYLDWVEDYYARAIAKMPRSFLAYQGRADAYRANKEFEKAIADYTHAIQLAPREADLYLGRGKCYQALNNPEKAAADFQSAFAKANKLHLKRQAEELLKNI
jgi:tetratricopeptide (TPR) repeat protein